MKNRFKRMIRFSCAAVTAGLLLLSSSPVSAAFWGASNELLHDPTMAKEGNTWYAFGTGLEGERGLRVLKAGSGGVWTVQKSIFTSPLSWWGNYVPNYGLNQWAPDVQFYNGKYWLYYAVSSFGKNTSAIGLASSASLSSGNWKDEGLVIRSTSANNYNAIDPELTIDKDGNPWLAFGSFWSGIKLTKLDKNTMKPTGSLYSIASRPNNGGALEAPAITYQNGYYYLMVSFDKCCSGVNSTYKIAYGRSKSITGPYLDKSGKSMSEGGGTILDSGNDRWKGPGGQDIVNGNILVRHAYDAENSGIPKMLINDIDWSSGWPSY
ncbi:glycoside hydrolase family 43 protein [Bacillus siamensis]|uniref:glycoside hydrolase family 43 protein n=1 Tax=Bacillus siamensis TaxID=659243 RepID=UPI003F66FB56